MGTPEFIQGYLGGHLISWGQRKMGTLRKGHRVTPCELVVKAREVKGEGWV